MSGKPAEPEITPLALADQWRHVMRAAQRPGISDTDSATLIERADALLDRLAEMPTNTGVVRAAEILFGHLARAAPAAVSRGSVPEKM
jgi:hypothetical protein